MDIQRCGKCGNKFDQDIADHECLATFTPQPKREPQPEAENVVTTPEPGDTEITPSAKTSKTKK